MNCNKLTNRLFSLIVALLICYGSTAGNTPTNPDKEQLLGTWHYTERDWFGMPVNEVYFSLYRDNRIFTVASSVPQPCSGSWKIDGPLFTATWDDYYFFEQLQTNAFNGNQWQFTDNNNKTQLAQKVSGPRPVPIPQWSSSLAPIRVQAPSSAIINLQQVYGQWKVTDAKGRTFLVNLYEDQRFYQSTGNKGNWSIANDLFYNFFESSSTVIVTKTTSFSPTAWIYELSNGEKLTAVKVSDQVRPFDNPPPPSTCANCKKPLKSCTCPPRDIPCFYCQNGSNQCSSCYGNGYHEVRHSNGGSSRQSCSSCSGRGRVTCNICHGKGVIRQ